MPSPTTSARRLPLWVQAATACAVMLAVAWAAVRPVSDLSPWLHLRVGEFLWSGGRFGQRDPWSSVAEGGYVPTQWLPSVLGHHVHQAFGVPGIAWMRAAGVVLLLLALLHLARETAGPLPALAVALVALAASWPSLTERPQLLGFVLLPPAVLAWWRTGHDHRARWWLVPHTWVFASSHGLWAVAVGVGGLVLLGLLAERRISREAALRVGAVLAASVVAAGLTPLGPRLLLTPLTVGSNGRRFVQEWAAPSAQEPAVALVLLLLAAAYLGWLTTGVRPPLWQLLLFLTAVAFTLGMARTVPVGAILAVPLAAGAAQGALARRPRRPAPPRRFAHLVWGAAALTAVALAVPLSAGRAQQPVGVPSGLADDLRALPAGTVILAEGDITGWVLFTAPQLDPVMDIRIEAYPAAHLRAFVAAMQVAGGWDRFVRGSGAGVALVGADSPMPEALVEHLGWSEVGRDGDYVLLEAAR